LLETGNHHATCTSGNAKLSASRWLQAGNAMAATALLKLAGLTNKLGTVDIAHQAPAQVQPMMSEYPLAFGQWLVALDYALSRPFEIVIVGSPDDEATQRLLSAAMSGFRPHQVVAYGPPGAKAPAVPLLEDRGLVDGPPAAYVCRDSSCRAPVTGVEGLRAQLERS
jgi:uncharacterized protein